MYKLIGTRASRAFRVLWLLEELALPYTHIPAAPRSDEVRAVNPSGKIPALVDGNETVCDSVAIMTYLADKHRRFTAAPGTLPRALQDAKTQQIVDEIDSLLWTAARHSFVLPQEHRVAGIKPSLMWEFERNLKYISKALTGPFIMGEDMTITDILLVHCLRWAEMAKFPSPDENMTAYKAKMQARPAFQRAVELP